MLYRQMSFEMKHFWMELLSPPAWRCTLWDKTSLCMLYIVYALHSHLYYAESIFRYLWMDSESKRAGIVIKLLYIKLESWDVITAGQLFLCFMICEKQEGHTPYFDSGYPFPKCRAFHFLNEMSLLLTRGMCLTRLHPHQTDRPSPCRLWVPSRHLEWVTIPQNGAEYQCSQLNAVH